VRNISAVTTIDTRNSYSLEGSFGAAPKNSRIVLNSRNVVDRTPPFAINRSVAMSYDATNAEPMGRVVSLSMWKKL
jgi:hypothetical protein